MYRCRRKGGWELDSLVGKEIGAFRWEKKLQILSEVLKFNMHKLIDKDLPLMFSALTSG